MIRTRPTLRPLFIRCPHRTITGVPVGPYYITTPIFYPNADPHIGHLHSLVIADVLARFQRIRWPKNPVHFLAGTDEHGLKIQQAANYNKLLPQDFCDKLSSRFRRLTEAAEISNTMFMRTTSPKHHKTVQDVWRELDSKGLIYKGQYTGWYSVSDECFYTDSQVTHIPARGKEKEKVVATETGSAVELSSEENYMFRVSAFREKLLDYYSSASDDEQQIFPSNYQRYIIDILKQPLSDLSISRPRTRLFWGVQVPDDPEHSVYVWFDALLIYLSGLGYPWTKGKGVRAAWPPNVQIVGKDIIRFHAIYFPAILLGLGLPLPKNLLTHAHWTVEQKKMSKSIGNVVDPFDAIQRYNVDVVRYYLLRVGGRFRDDVDWSEAQLQKHAKEFESALGNYYLRIMSPRIMERLPHPTPDISLSDILDARDHYGLFSLIKAARTVPASVAANLENLQVSEALSCIVDVMFLANKVFSDIAPFQEDVPPVLAYKSLRTSLEVLRLIGIVLQPFTPGAAGRLLDALGVPVNERTYSDLSDDDGVNLTCVKTGVRLFPAKDKGVRSRE
ncbi:hypothetical protein FISHEDRAFT_77731 [Fistulina hepatica ATCC 64428]|nr:hypothetical protein FISHEDRAFT_77731 [Fistulina hepatica ATCC 64428]